MIKKKKTNKKLKQVDEKTTEEELEDLAPFMILDSSLSQESEASKLRTISLYGEIEEEIASEIVYAFYAMKEFGSEEKLKDPNDPDSETIISCKPIEFLISTHGGAASEMFSIYDTMRMVRESCEIHTLGLGKVMSAGVLLLASGTKGKRRIAKNCRIMIHSVMAAHHGSLHSLENEMDEIRYLQQQHINCLVEETSMTKSYLKKLMNKKINVYLTAEKAIELGIADEIV